MRLKKRQLAKKFKFLIDTAAFVDRVELSIASGTPRVSSKRILEPKNQGIRNSKSFHSRCLTGKFSLNGNPFSIAYAKIFRRRYKQVPECRVLLHSEEGPWTGAQVSSFIQSVFPNATGIRITLVELTWDVSTITFPEFSQNVVHRATYRKIWGNGQTERTLYIGSRTSPLQARIYEKWADVLRVELVLRRPFLKKYKLQDVNNLVRLRTLQTWQWLSLRKYSRDRVIAAMGKSVDTEWIEIACGSGNQPRVPLQRVRKHLRLGKIDPDEVLWFSRDQLQLEKMLKNFIW